MLCIRQISSHVLSRQALIYPFGFASGSGYIDSSSPTKTQSLLLHRGPADDAHHNINKLVELQYCGCCIPIHLHHVSYQSPQASDDEHWQRRGPAVKPSDVALHLSFEFHKSDMTRDRCLNLIGNACQDGTTASLTVGQTNCKHAR
ncbi:hypothetical protein PMIN03_007695 [Paraphaeosphaeria minitans]